MIKGNYYYVDKTMLIKDVVELPGKVKLITRPRRFGKTLNIDMLKRFFSMEEEGDIFEGLAIQREKGIVKDYYHKYPVVFISFKDVKETSWRSAVVHLKNLLSDLVLKYTSLEIEKGLKKKLEYMASMEAEEGVYTDSLRIVTWALHEAVGKKAIVLIDEYDVPIEAAYTYKGKDPEYYENMVSFMRGLLTAALKDNPHLEFGVLTGVYRVAKESIFSGLNNLEVFTVFDPAIEDKFGFTEEETFRILESYGLGREDKKAIDRWYGGYTVGKAENLYNPWSVMKYVNERVVKGQTIEDSLQPYWINTSSNDLIIEQVKKNREIKRDIDKLLEGKEVRVSIDTSLSLRELETREEGVWVLFASSGYLSAKRIRRSKYSMRIPNEEILEFFKGAVMEWIKHETKMDMRRMLDGLDEMLHSGRYEDFVEYLERFIEDGLSYYDVAGSESGRFYKGFLLGLLSIAINGRAVESEMESGYGRLDVVIYPKDKTYGGYAVIFEVKRSDDEKELEEIAKRALEQIKERKYYARMKEKGYKVIGFGIAFCGKRTRIEASLIGNPQ